MKLFGKNDVLEETEKVTKKVEEVNARREKCEFEYSADLQDILSIERLTYDDPDKDKTVVCLKIRDAKDNIPEMHYYISEKQHNDFVNKLRNRKQGIL